MSLLQEFAAHSDAEVSGRNDTVACVKIPGRGHRPSLYKEDIPSECAFMQNHIISSIESSFSSAGLDVFKDDSFDNTMFVCGGDITLQKYVEENATLTVSLTTLRISHAPQGG